MKLTRRDFITKAAMGALAFALPSKHQVIFGEPRTIKRTSALYGLALREDSEPITFFNEGIVSGAVSMRGFQIG
jgi:hypothetical protein